MTTTRPAPTAIPADEAPYVLDDPSHGDVWRDPLSPLALLARTLRVFPSREAVTYRGPGGDVRLTWSEFGELVGRFAAALRAAGVRRGDRVAVLLPNVPVHLASTFAIPLAGGVIVAINTRLARAEVGYILRHSDARVLLVDPELSGQVDLGSLAEDVVIVNVPDSVWRVESPLLARAGETPLTFESWTDGVDPLPVANTVADERELLAINYTSGTTGQPKGVMYTHRGAYLNAVGEVGSLQLQRSTVFLWTLPMFHCNGWCMPWAVTAAAGRHVCLRAVRPAEIVRLVQAEGVTNFNGAPTVLRMIAADPATEGVRFDPPVTVCTGGAPPSPTDLERMEALGVRVQHLYGLTETYGPHVLCEAQDGWESLPLAERARLQSRQGVPYPHAVYLRVVDEAMADVPADGETLGEVVMRGNNVMAGYFEDPAATAEAFRGGWFHSGDIAVVHPDGYIELRDRSKDVIISGGENISSIEVENLLYQHPAVHEVAVIGVPDEKWGEVVAAYVAPAEGYGDRDAVELEAEIIAWARERLTHFKAPKSITFGELPKTSTGKIQKFKLREAAWGAEGRRIN